MKIFNKRFFIFILIFLSIDFVTSKIFFKNLKSWNLDLYKGKPWRIVSEQYHHDLSKYINVIEKWGENSNNLITNSLGFRDFSKRQVSKINNKKRILLIGDSFIEGLGYDYEHTLAGLLQNYYGDDYEILNSAVASYSPSIYYLKTKYLINEGYKFNKALIFLDLSDVIDEMHLELNFDGTLKTPIKNLNKFNIKKIIYAFGHFLRENFITFRFFSILSDQSEIFKNYLKDRHYASKLFNKDFLKTSKKDLNLFRMITVKRGNWIKNGKTFTAANEGLYKSEISLKKLFNLLNKNKVESYLIIYPWPSQIYHDNSNYENFWNDFTSRENIKFINLHPYFNGRNKEEIIYENFIKGDIHWNKKGTLLIFKAIKEKRIL